MNIIPRKLVEKLNTEKSDLDYDTRLYNLGKRFDEFYVVNPAFPEFYIDYIDSTIVADECIIWIRNNDWVVKKFNKKWDSSKGWKTIDIKLPQQWITNKQIKGHFKFFESEEKSYVIEPWAEDYIHVWYLDAKFNNGSDRIWLFETFLGNREDKIGVKDMGNVTPFIPRHDVKHNSELPAVFNETNYNIPYSDTKYKHIWYLDPKYYSYFGIDTTDKIWVESRSATATPTGVKDMGYLMPFVPRHEVKYNSELPAVFNETNYCIPYSDIEYEHVWYLDPKYYHYFGIETTDKIWVESRSATANPVGVKDMGYLMPFVQTTLIKHNIDLPNYDFGIDYQIPYADAEYEHVWYLDPSHHKYFNIVTDDKIWVESRSTTSNPLGVKDMGYIKIKHIDNLDVVFLSYNEPHAEENWQRVLEKAPHAKRVNGVTGIFNAHKAAAEIAETDIFYVVDGDATLTDDWSFDFVPTHWGMVSVHVFQSINPVNGLVYGYGAVKMFPRKLLLSANRWNIDVTTSVTHNVRVINRISNITKFNTDPFTSWCAAFRECTKLSSKVIGKQKDLETDKRLSIWTTEGADKPFGEYVISGANAGKEFGEKNRKNPKELKKINDKAWLLEQFNTIYAQIH